MRPILTLLAAALWLGAALPAAAQQARSPRPPEVDEVRFTGVRALSERLLRDSIVTRESRCRSPLLVPACAVGEWRWAERKAFLDTVQVRRDEERIRALYAAWVTPRPPWPRACRCSPTATPRWSSP